MCRYTRESVFLGRKGAWIAANIDRKILLISLYNRILGCELLWRSDACGSFSWLNHDRQQCHRPASAQRGGSHQLGMSIIIRVHVRATPSPPPNDYREQKIMGLALIKPTESESTDKKGEQEQVKDRRVMLKVKELCDTGAIKHKSTASDHQPHLFLTPDQLFFLSSEAPVDSLSQQLSPVHSAPSGQTVQCNSEPPQRLSAVTDSSGGGGFKSRRLWCYFSPRAEVALHLTNSQTWCRNRLLPPNDSGDVVSSSLQSSDRKQPQEQTKHY